MPRTITYAVDEDGTVYSRVDREVAVPVLDFAAIGQGGDGFKPGNFNGPIKHNLQKFALEALYGAWASLRWTKKIPVGLKNRHRAFWGMKPLAVPDGAGSPTLF